MIRVVHPGSRILMLTFSHPGSRIPDPGVKKVPNPGSGSATLMNPILISTSLIQIHMVLYNNRKIILLNKSDKQPPCFTTIRKGSTKFYFNIIKTLDPDSD